MTTETEAPKGPTKSIFDLFETDQTKEREGITVDYRDYGNVTLARAGGANKRFSEVFERKVRPHRRAIENGTMQVDEMRRLTAEAFAETIVLGWNFIDKNKQPIPFSRKTCVEFLIKVPDALDEWRDLATSFANFRAQEIETDAKN